MGYPFESIEPKWQAYWEKEGCFRALDGDTSRPKYYILDMFPYPSGAGLHVGHPEGYTATDILSRFKRMQGFNVLHPMGWDAFGLPAEQYAIQTGTHPAATTAKNVQNFKKQIQSLGFSYDWDREINTTDPGYYKWTQWIFLKLYNSWYDKEAQRGRPIEELPIPAPVQEEGELAVRRYRDDHRLAYVDEIPVNWCEALGTVLANEEVIDGLSERGNHPVVRLPLKQWMLRITTYAERLLKDLDSVEWPEPIKKQQRDWIGRSEGADVWFGLEIEAREALLELIDGRRVRKCGTRLEFKIYTTRPDTLFGVTYMVLSPEHALVPLLTTEAQSDEVAAYCERAARKSEMERTELAKEKTGVFTGAYAVNPVNGERVPIWIADYVLASYGTGAIMAVPAHDQRDFEFATAFDIPIRTVIVPEASDPEAKLEAAVPASGRMHASGAFTGLPNQEAGPKIVEWLAAQGVGAFAVNYKLRDWLFSRQRYWGEPFPILWDDEGHLALEASELPLVLPDLEDFRPSGRPEALLSKAGDWTRVQRGGKEFRRELNTMPQWAGSCWYYLRYLDPKNDAAPFAAEKERYWMPVDLYIGGAEHAVLHLLYSRFWHKVLYDLHVVSTPEPFMKLVNQGLILGEDNEKMSKSSGNVVNPDEIIRGHGADAFRMYEMFMGPLEAAKPWNTRNIEGIDRFLNRVWRLIIDREGEGINPAIRPVPVEGELRYVMHNTIKTVTDDLEGLRFNTAISALMVFVNKLLELSIVPREAVDVLVHLLAPFAPHQSEELWQRLGNASCMALADWPPYDESALVLSTIEMVVQVNGKVRAKLQVPPEIEKDSLEALAFSDSKVKKYTDGKAIKKVIIVPKRLVNIVAQ